MNKEDYFIKQFNSSRLIGDDGAVVGIHNFLHNDNLVYSSDAFFEEVHFKREWMNLKQIATKAMLVNISDAISMNAIPKYALLTVAIPSDFTKKELKQLALGFNNVAKSYNIEIIGGDTISNTKLDISITIIATTKNPIYRTGTSIDDLICYTGKLGSSKEALENLLLGKSVSKKHKFIKPKLRGNFFYEIAPYINSALDISDGLFFELERLSKANKISFEFFKSIHSDIGCSGEEYEMLFTFNPKYKKKIKNIAKKHKLKLNIFAKAIAGKYKCECKGHHFG